jgi:Tfp pilus assembly protein PilF
VKVRSIPSSSDWRRVRTSWLFALALSFGSSFAHAQDSSDAREQARTRFDRGVQLYNDQEYERALIEFDRAYALAPSYHVLFNIAQVSAQLRKYAKAVKTFERYLEEGGAQIPADRVAEVQKELAAARARTAKLLVRVNQPAAEITLDDQPFATSPMKGDELVDSGPHRMGVSKEGYAAVTRPIVLAGGDVTTVDIDLKPVEAPRAAAPAEAQPNRTPAWVAWGTAGAFTAGTIVFGLFALNASSDLDRLKRTRGSTEGQRDDAATKLETFATTADVLGGIAVISAGVALYLTLRKGPSSHPSAQVGAGPSSLVVRGTF